MSTQESRTTYVPTCCRRFSRYNRLFYSFHQVCIAEMIGYLFFRAALALETAPSNRLQERPKVALTESLSTLARSGERGSEGSRNYRPLVRAHGDARLNT